MTITANSAFHNANNFTISMFIKPDVLGSDDMFFTLGSSTTAKFDFRFLDSSGNLRFVVYAANGDFSSGNADAQSSGQVLNTTDYWHIVGVFDNDNNSQKIYINATERASKTPTIDSNTASANLIIGNRSGGSLHFDGHIGQVKFFSKALSASEVTAEYDANKATYGLS